MRPPDDAAGKRRTGAENRLPMFCLKPAPVQVNMVGYFVSPLMDHRGFTRKLEVAYRQMWKAWCGAG
jgi:predicted O-linked N-acetylglucosamine transferase (SPINDLY family)